MVSLDLAVLRENLRALLRSFDQVTSSSKRSCLFRDVAYDEYHTPREV